MNKHLKIYPELSLGNFRELWNRLFEIYENFSTRNLIRNSNFKKKDKDGKPLYWESENVSISFESEGTKLSFSNGLLRQTVPGDFFEPNRNYFFTLKIKRVSFISDLKIKVIIPEGLGKAVLEDGTVTNVVEESLISKDQIGFALKTAEKISKSLATIEISGNGEVVISDIAITAGIIQRGQNFDTIDSVFKFEDGFIKFVNNDQEERIVTDSELGKEIIAETASDLIDQIVKNATKRGLELSYDKENRKLTIDVNDFTVQFTGDVQGTLQIKDLQNAEVDLTVKKINGISWDKFAFKDLSNVEDSTILNKLTEVDGSGSGLDADLLDGKDGSYYADKFLTNVDDLTVLEKLKRVDGPNSGLNADLLDGFQADSFALRDLSNVELIAADLIDVIKFPEGSESPHPSSFEPRDGFYAFEAANSTDFPGPDQQGFLIFTADGSRATELTIGWELNGRIKNVALRALSADTNEWSEWRYLAFNDLENVEDIVILNKLRNVDGSGSGLDADMLDGKQSEDFAYNDLSNVNDQVILNKLKNVDGSGSGLDADLLDGLDSKDFMPNPYNLPVARAGDSSFLDIPVYTDYEGSAYPFRTNLGAIKDGSRIYVYRIGTNGKKRRAYISYTDDDFNTVINLSQEYRPADLEPTKYIWNIWTSSEKGMLVTLRDENDRSFARRVWIDFNGSGNPANHTIREIPDSIRSWAWGIKWVPEKQIWLTCKWVNENGKQKFIYRIYSEDGSNIIAESSGFVFPDDLEIVGNYHGRPYYHTYFPPLTYFIRENGNLVFLNYVCFWIYGENRDISPDLSDILEFDGSSLRRITTGHYVFDGTNNSFHDAFANSRHRMYYVSYLEFDNKLYSFEHYADNTVYTRVKIFEGTKEDLIINNLGVKERLTLLKSKNIIPPDASPYGKQIMFTASLKLNDGKNYVFVYGRYYDQSNKQLKNSKSLVTPPEIEGDPKEILEVQVFPSEIYLNKNVGYNWIYQFENNTFKLYKTKDQITNNTPESEYQVPDLTDVDTQIESLVLSTVSLGNPLRKMPVVYYVPETNIGIRAMSFIFDKDDQNYLFVIAYSLFNMENGQIIGNPEIITQGEYSKRYYYSNVYFHTTTAAFYFDGTSYYGLMEFPHIRIIGGSPMRFYRIKLTNQNVDFIEPGPIKSRWEFSLAFVHPDYGFGITDSFNHSEYLKARMSNQEIGSNPEEALRNLTGSISSESPVILTLRPAIGFNVSFGEFPAMLGGHFDYSQFKTFSNLKPNTTYYAYLVHDENYNITVDLLEEFKGSSPEKLFLGTITTDDVGVSGSDVEKKFMISGFEFFEDKIVPSIEHTKFVGTEEKPFKAVYADNIFAKEEVVSDGWISAKVIGNNSRIWIGGDGVNDDYEIKLESPHALTVWSPNGQISLKVYGKIYSNNKEVALNDLSNVSRSDLIARLEQTELDPRKILFEHLISDPLAVYYQEFSYDSQGNVTKVEIYSDSSKTNKIGEVNYEYDGDRLIRETRQFGSVQRTVTYNYDENGNLISISSE